MNKPKILICSDSAILDTGFGRVVREIGTGLMKSGRYRVVQHGWFHTNNDRLVPFPIIPTTPRDELASRFDDYGQLTYDTVVEREQPDLVLAIGDPWIIQHMASKPRRHLFVGYTPIDSGPVSSEWIPSFAAMDKLVLFGRYAVDEVLRVAPDLKPLVIPHGIDTNVFRPLEKDEYVAERNLLSAGHPERFIIGCVARNSERKQIPRLIKAYSQYLHPWIVCMDCGEMITVFAKDKEAIKDPHCPSCQSKNVRIGDGNRNSMLYLHCAAEDPAGHKLIPLISRYNLNGHVTMPDNMMIGKGVPDWQLNKFYNAMDLFTLPTSGEGWGLPISEAMAAGTPVLVTKYSAHVDYVAGAGEFIEVKEWSTFTVNNCERAMTDITDHHMKMDRFSMPFEQFWYKWEAHFQTYGITKESIQEVKYGPELCESAGKRAHERIKAYDWSYAVALWVKLFDSMLADAFTAPVNNSSTVGVFE